MTGPAYNSQAAASSRVVAGEKLKIPLSRAPYQVFMSTVSETSKARSRRPGRNRASCRSCTP